jgi:rhamnose transport system substrate-binding protein
VRQVKVSGLGLPAEMVSYTMNGCAPEFALWSFVDLGYLTYYTSLPASPRVRSRARSARIHRRPHGHFTIEEGPGPRGGKRILMGPFTVYNKDNVEAEAQ